MSTRASAPRCASCGMPLAPDAESCAVCGARVPLIARPASGDDEPAPVADGLGGAAPSAAVPLSPLSSQQLSSQPLPLSPSSPLSPAPAAGPPGATFDAARAAREVRSAARPSGPSWVRPGEVPGIATRVVAHAVDVLVVVVAAAAGLVVDELVGTGTPVVAGLLGLVVAVVQVVAEGRGGATLGARVRGLRTVDERTGAVPGVPRALLRQLVLALGTLVLLVGNWVVAVSGAWDSGPRRRGWHDKASGTTVVAAAARQDAPGRRAASLQPEDRRGSSPWTPTPPSGAPARGPAEDDASFAPPPVTGPPSAEPPPGPPTGAVPPAPDLLPPAPAVTGPSSSAVREPAADLLPPPPAPGRRSRAAAPSAAPEASPSPGAPSTTASEPSLAAASTGGPTAPPSASPTFGDDDLAELEHTRVRDPESLRRRTGTLALHFDTGERVRVVGRGLVGRGPRAEDGEDILHVVALNDAARSLSRVHAEFGPQVGAADEDAAIWVTDRGSTNGTVVVDPRGAARVLPPGTRAMVRAGWTVRLGDREARVEDD